MFDAFGSFQACTMRLYFIYRFLKKPDELFCQFLRYTKTLQITILADSLTTALT